MAISNSYVKLPEGSSLLFQAAYHPTITDASGIGDASSTESTESLRAAAVGLVGSEVSAVMTLWLPMGH